jgi:hypothetical protein
MTAETPATQYPARDRLFALIASIPDSGTANWCDHARVHLDDYRAEVLAERAVSSPAPAARAAAQDPTPLRWGLNDVLWGDDDTVTVLLSGPAGEPYWLELDPERAGVLREDLAGPDGAAVVDRAAVLRELADRADPANEASWFGDFGHLVGEWIRKQADYEERRLAGEARDEREAPHPETAFTPRRGDSVEAWLRDWRDQFGHKGPTWVELDNVLDDYRLHADTGTPLGEHVCEGRAVGDCDCLELPEAAEGAQQ